MSTCNDLNHTQPYDSADQSTPQKSAPALCSSNFNSAVHRLSVSTASLSEGNNCAQHQYHYIQYPPYYHHPLHQQPLPNGQQMAMPQSPSTSTSVGCYCHCACGTQQQQQFRQQTPACHNERKHSSIDSQVVVQVHQQATDQDADRDRNRDRERPTKAQSEQSLLNHSYQTLQISNADTHSLTIEQKPLNISCDCDLECTCGASAPARNNATASAGDCLYGDETATQAVGLAHHKSKQCQADAMLAADEITVSESDNNSTMIKKKKPTRDGGGRALRQLHSWCPELSAEKSGDPSYHSSHMDIYSEGDNKSGIDDTDDARPPLPPRPPPPRMRNSVIHRNAAHRHHGTGVKKYVVWCLVCGGFSCLLGILFLGVYFLLHSYTITVGNFETVPTFVPAALLILTGLCIMSLARRRNRYSYLIKLSGACGLISALTCALVTVTTTVLHMSRLQALRECEYAQKTRTCTCYSDLIESQVDRVDKEGVRLVFDSLSDCGVVHGSLYSCLRAIFGLSVAGVLIAVFSCMLVYQLLSHERKKMYWEQLELRCRSLYTSQQGPPPNMAALASARGTMCRCCEQCHAHRQLPLPATAYPWDDGGEPRFWTGQPPGNFYSPNPGGDDLQITSPAGGCRGHGANNSRNRATGWSWPRMPWQRSSPDPNARQFRQTPSSPDSQYGFTNTNGNATGENLTMDASGEPNAAPAPFNVVAAALPYGVWGPPPPYSDPNSPARRGYYQYIERPPCGNMPNNNNNTNNLSNVPNERVGGNFINAEPHMPPCLNHRSVFLDQPGPPALNTSGSAYGVQSASMRHSSVKRQQAAGGSGKSKAASNYENTPSDSDCGARDRFSNTLPTRKVKKRIEAGAKFNIVNGAQPQPAPRVAVQQLFASNPSAGSGSGNEQSGVSEPYEEQLNAGINEDASLPTSVDANNAHLASVHQKRALENNGFQEHVDMSTGAEPPAHEMTDPTESEVYFADVSSCCNMSLKNDNYYEDANHPVPPHQQRPHEPPQHHHQNSNCSNNSSNDEDYLAQRFGQRENSIRSRLPFPQNCNGGDYEQQHNRATNVEQMPMNTMQKEYSCQSMCSVESEAKTELTDLSPATPSVNKFAQTSFDSKPNNEELLNENAAAQRNAMPNFVATFPYSSESQSLEAHRRSTKDAHELMLLPEAHYEVINDNSTCQFASVRSSGRPTQQPMAAQRPNNLMGSKRQVKHGSKMKERSNIYNAECVNWSNANGGGTNNAGNRQAS